MMSIYQYFELSILYNSQSYQIYRAQAVEKTVCDNRHTHTKHSLDNTLTHTTSTTICFLLFTF